MVKSSSNKLNKNTVILIDGSSFIYRAYFAIPGYLATTKGFPTKAIFGVTQMVLKILKEWDPEYIIWFMDEKEPTFRHEIYENYKATRPKMPDDLKIQIPYIRNIIQSLGIPVLSHPGYEGDDLIASFIKNLIKEQDLSAIIVAGDKDLYSLIDKNIAIYDPVREKFLDLNAFLEKYQFPPQVFPEFRALTGDPSDNIPGVPGIGEKTAKELLIKFKNLEDLYENIKQISLSKLRENLLKYKDQILNNLNLLTLNYNAPLPSFDILYYKRREPDYSTLRKIFKELEFRKLLSEIKYTPPEFKPLLIENKDLSQIPERDYLSLFPLQYQGYIFNLVHAPEMAVAFSEKEAYKLSTSCLKDLISKFTKTKFILHDYKNFLKLFGLSLNKVFDTKLASYLLNPSLKKYELEFLLQEYLDISLGSIKISKNEEIAIKTCGLYLLGKELINRIEEEGLSEWFEKVEIPLSEVLFEMEKKGFKIDLEYVRTLNQEYQKTLKELEDKLFEIAGCRFNPKSSQEVSDILFKKLNLPSLKKTPKSSLPSTDAEVLEELAPLHPFVKLLIQYRTLYKIKSTYLEVFLKYASTKTHRIHTEFNQTGTATGRLSSQNPNLQNIPIKGEEGLSIRRAFIAEDGNMLCSLDYSQIELRILAHFSEDKNLISAFKKGEDIHTFTACEVFGVTPEKVTPEMRRMSKAINFGIAYGMSAYGLAKELKISPKSAETIINRYFNRYPGIKEYIQKTIEFAKENGYVKTLVGRKRYIPELFSSNKGVKELGQRMAINTPIQGSAADLIKCAMVALQKELKKHNLKTAIILQVHDELVLEVPEEEIEIIKELAPKIMENPFKYLNLPYKLNVPIKVNFSFGKNWAECK
jgi:DNA polymerase-1